MSKLTTERRAHARHPRTFELEGSLPSENSTTRMVASNLSAGGINCTSSVGYDEMTRLAVRLLLPTGGKPEPLDAEAVVVRRRALVPEDGGNGYELALFFTKLEDTDRERIERYLDD